MKKKKKRKRNVICRTNDPICLSLKCSKHLKAFCRFMLWKSLMYRYLVMGFILEWCPHIISMHKKHKRIVWRQICVASVDGERSKYWYFTIIFIELSFITFIFVWVFGFVFKFVRHFHPVSIPPLSRKCTVGKWSSFLPNFLFLYMKWSISNSNWYINQATKRLISDFKWHIQCMYYN